MPLSDPGEVERTLAEDSNRWLLAVLRLLVHPTDSLAWWSLVNLQTRLGENFVNYLFTRAISTNSTFGEAFVAAANDGFAGSPSHSRNQAVTLWQEISGILDAVRLPETNDTTRWGEWIVGEAGATRLPRCSDGLENLLLKIDQAIEAGQELERFLSQIQPVGEDLMRTQSNGVRFMTMTGSKGLTVRATIVVGVENDLIPRPDQDVAEERRLLYVAMTRSREYLFLTWANRRRGPAARSGRTNVGRRHPSDFFRGGPVESENGLSFIQGLGGM